MSTYHKMFTHDGGGTGSVLKTGCKFPEKIVL